MNAKISLTAIILTNNEEIHINRCIRSLRNVASRILVVDSFSTDRTVEIAQALGAEVRQRSWYNYSDQFQWAISQVTNSTWIMRMDADEYLETDLCEELAKTLVSDASWDGIYLNRKVVFQRKWIKYGGTYPQTLLRIWKAEKGAIEQRWMDEHIILPADAQIMVARGNLVDENLKGIGFWTSKCNAYASREALDLLNLKYGLLPRDDALSRGASSQAKTRRKLKEAIYSKLPLGIRPLIYFFYRYILLLGFIDGVLGFQWHLLQGLWYRLLVDIKILEIERESKGDPETIREIFHRSHGISL